MVPDPPQLRPPHFTLSRGVAKRLWPLERAAGIEPATSALGRPRSTAELCSQTPGPLSGQPAILKRVLRRSQNPGMEGPNVSLPDESWRATRLITSCLGERTLLCEWRESNPRDPRWQRGAVPLSHTRMLLFSENVRFVLDSRGGPYSQPSVHRPGSYPGVRLTLGSCDPELVKGIEPPTFAVQKRCSTVELHQQVFN